MELLHFMWEGLPFWLPCTRTTTRWCGPGSCRGPTCWCLRATQGCENGNALSRGILPSGI